MARLLLDHGAADAALALAPSTSPDGRGLRAEAILALPPVQRAAAWALDRDVFREQGCGRAAFDLCLWGGDEEGAERVTTRTPGDEGRDLRDELELRRGRLRGPSADSSPLHRARAAWLSGAPPDDAQMNGADPEFALLAASAFRRRGDAKNARAALDRARGLARHPLPGLSLEALLQHLTPTRFVVHEQDLLEPIAWALGPRASGPLHWPRTWQCARALHRIDNQLGPFRGAVLTRVIAGRIAPLVAADDLRQRAASLRMALRVEPAEEVLARAAELSAACPDSPCPPAYEAELLHWFGRYQDAGRRCEEGIRRDPFSRWAWIGLAQARMWSGELDAARAALATLRRRLPRLATLHAALGELELLSGQPQLAVRHLRTAVDAHPTRRSAWLLLAQGLLALGREDQATVIVATLRTLAPQAWFPAAAPGDLAGDVGIQLAAMLGNRSSSFVTLIREGEAALLLQGPALGPMR